MPNAPKDPNDPTFPIPRDASDASLGSLDFERADRTANTARVCAQCATPITDRYYTLGPHVLCESCNLAFQNAKAPGNAASRFFGAAALGTVAAAIGCALWMVVTELTGYEIGLIAIAVGYLVGRAVHIGARRVGGMAYQLLAVFLTYSAVVMTYVPMIANQFMATEGVQQEAQTSLSDEFVEDNAANSAPSAGTAEDVEAPVVKPGVDELSAWIAAIPIAYMLPFLMGFENAIGILIVGFALWQAFRMNARVKIELQGPFRLEARDASLG
jgi:hypothetical protein